MAVEEQVIFTAKGPRGIPVEIWASSLLLPLVFLDFGQGFQSFVYDLMFLFLLVGSIYLHELGHAWGALVQGLPVRRIVLHGGGGFCQRERRASPYESELILAMGPIVNLGIWAVASMIAPLIADPEIQWVFAALAWINLYLALFNLLPVMPLDGGKLLHLILLRLMSPALAERVSGLVGLFVAILFVPLLIAGFFLMGLILFFLPSVPLHWKMLRGVA